MNHDLCRECETANWCSRNGCIPIQSEPEEFTQERTFGWLALVLALTLAVALAGVATVWANWPLFLAAVK